MKIKNLEEVDGFWQFQFGSGDDFTKALRELKKIPLEDRKYHENLNGRKHVWEVRKGEFDHRLVRMFENFGAQKETIENQVSLFD